MKNAEVAQMLNDIADMLDMQGEAKFKVIAYQTAARRIEGLTEDVADLVAEKRLSKIRGIGESISAKVTEFVTTGKCAYHDAQAEKLPPGLAKMLQIPGVGAKRARQFYEELHISTVDELEEACRTHRLRQIPKLKEKTERNVLEGIQRLKQRTGRMLLGTALPVAEEIVEHLRDNPAVEQIETGGSIRRRKETIRDIDILVASAQPKDAVEAFTTLHNVRSILAKGKTKASVLTDDDLQVDLRVVSPDEWGAALQYFTGSKDHNVQLRGLAASQGLKVNEYGLFRVETNEKIAGADEEGIYRALGMPWIPPEIREAAGEIEAALAGRLPDLVELKDIRGDLHAHSNWSDGHSTMEQMAYAAMERGYEYLAITDHSSGLGFIGLTIERIYEQREAIDALNEEYEDFRLLQGIEVNIRGDGTLDYPDDVLARFDVVTASIHGGLNQSRERITERMLSAIRNPHVDIIGHPSGRLINKRDPSDFDEEAVFAAAAETGTALEINSQPDRLDLKDSHARRAMDAGADFAIDSDSHAADQLGLVRYGTATARRGWVEKDRVLNTLPLDALLKRLQRQAKATR